MIAKIVRYSVSSLFLGAALAGCTPQNNAADGGDKAVAAESYPGDAELKWQSLFTNDGPVTEGWTVRDWAKLDKPAKAPVTWNVIDGVLYGTGRYTWCGDDSFPCWVGTVLASDRDYANFVLELEFKFWQGGKDRANGGVLIRTPLQPGINGGGMEVQITDPGFQRKYSPRAKGDEMTGGIYSISAPSKEAYRAGEWNRYRIEANGAALKVWLNGEKIQDLDLASMTKPAMIYNDDTDTFEPGTSAAERPRTGRVALQDLSEYGDAVIYRNVRIAELP